MVHLHNRDERGYHKSTVELMKETVDKIVTKCPTSSSSPVLVKVMRRTRLNTRMEP